MTLIEKLTTSPVLGFADLKLPFVLHTDASTTGLGAALYQEQDGQSRVIDYASRGLSSSESRYPAHKLEFLALKWAIVEKFHDYLYGTTFTVLTDNNPLTYILTSAKLDAASYRWLAALSTFTFSIKYRAGKQNQDADGLSRRPHGELMSDQASLEEHQRIQQFTSQHLSLSAADMPADVVTAACNKHLCLAEPDPSAPVTLVESLALHPGAVPDVFEEDDCLEGHATIPRFSDEELRRKQSADPVIGQVIYLLESGNKVTPQLMAESSEFKLMAKEWSRLELKNGILYRNRQCNSQPVCQLVLPQELRPIVLKGLHDDMGHLGVERTLDLVRSRFYWPKMAADVERKIKACGRCV